MLSGRAVGFAVALLATLRVACAQVNPSAALDARLDLLITDAMQAQQIPALTVAVATGERLVYSKAFGTSDLENQVAATRETLIRTASIAKSITAVAAMTLVQAGKLNLDTPVQTYCAPFPPKQWPITMRELLSHSSGIRHYRPGEPEYTQHYKWLPDAFAIFANDPLLFRPGSAYSYSTYGYTVAGCVVEGAAGIQFQEYVAEHVLKPAGMAHTFVDDVFEILPHRARGYQKVAGQVKNAVLMDSSYKIPGGGYVTTAEDLVRFAQALLDGKLLQQSLVAQMWTPSQVSGPSGYGLGFQLLDGGKFVMHTGGQAGTSTELFIIPKEHFALAVLANMDNVRLKDLVRGMLQQLQQPLPSAQP